MSMKNERGYSFTPPSTLNRGRSYGSDQPGHAGSDVVVGYPGHRSNDAYPLSSSGEVSSAEKKLLSKDNEGVRTFGGGQGTAEAEEDGECGTSSGKSSSGSTPRSLTMSSSHFRHGSNISVDVSAPSPYKVDSLYADLASPSPWNNSRPSVAAATTSTIKGSPPQCTSPKMIRERRPLTSPGEILTAEDQQPTSPSPSSAPEIKYNAAVEKGMSQLPSLTCSSLVESDKIRKAENIVAAMVKLADFNAFESVDREEGGVGVPLPSKMQITRAMGILETKLKSKTEEAEALKKEVKAIQTEEREAEQRIVQMEKEEGERIAKEEEGQVQRMQCEHDTLRRKREDAMTKKLLEISDQYEARQYALQEKRQAEILRMKELCQSDIQGRVSGLNSQVSTLNDQLQEVQRQISELENNQKQLELSQTAFHFGMTSSSVDGIALGPITADDETTSDGPCMPTLDLPGKMSGLVANIIAQNQMIAKRSHMDVLESIAYFPGAEDDDAAMDDVTTRGNNENNSSISNQAWSNRARRVTGQHDALYTEPTEVPYFHENNEHFMEIAPLIKECIRRKNEKLKSRWTMLAEHYVLRQMMYNEQTGMTGDMSERGGHFSAAGSLLCSRGASYDAMNTMESSSSTPNSKNGTGGGSGSVSQPNPGVRGNNPYRRPRRGISLGDVVRSDYEQEQIIAEIAAKEAMEKRIKEGGCALPRQRGWLENVRISSL